MASLKIIRKRIGSVKNTQKITRAMKMVAAARLRRAQQSIWDVRPYAQKTLEVLSSVAARVLLERQDDKQLLHPLLAKRPPNQVLLLVITSDRGLAGGFNSNLNRKAFKFLKQLEAEGKSVSIAVVGRKGRDYFRRREVVIHHEFAGIYQRLSMHTASEIGRYVVHLYEEKSLDAVYLVYNEFKSAMSQHVVLEPLLPITPMELPADSSQDDFIYEPNKTELLNRLLPLYIDVEVYRALLESVASEHGARMTAMDAATKNASEMISRLTLQFNRARQAAITKELMEIIGGAEAIKA